MRLLGFVLAFSSLDFSSFVGFLDLDSSSASILSLNPLSFPKIPITMKFFVLLIGLHSMILTTSPSLALILSGLWALTLLFLLSYLSYFLRKCFLSHSTVTVFCILADITVPTNVLPLRLKLLFGCTFPCSSRFLVLLVAIFL